MPVTPTIRTADGLALHARLWEGRAPRGILVVSHGLGEHGGCYGPMAEPLTAMPGLVDVLAFDYRGHGLSPGRRGVVRRYADLLLDLDAALEWAGRARPQVPRFVLGHSNGGQVALHDALAHPGRVAGLILSSPSLALAAAVPRWKIGLGRVLHAVAPWVTLSAALDDSMMTSDAASWPARQADRLRHTRISAPLYFGMVAGGLAVAERAAEIRTPTLMLLGERDPVVDAQVNRAFFDRLGAEDKTLLVYPEMLHEPLSEIGREDVLDEIARWLAARLDRIAATRQA